MEHRAARVEGSPVESQVLYGTLFRKELIARMRLRREDFVCDIWNNSVRLLQFL
jgi:hypothetical protein